MNASDKRDKPFFVDEKCPDCNTALVLADLHENPDAPADGIWYDEWWCPVCNDGIIMDWPPEELEALHQRMDAVLDGSVEGAVPLDDLEADISTEELRELLGLPDDVAITVVPGALDRKAGRGDC